MAESSINMKFTANTADAQKRIAELEKEVARLNKETKESSSASTSAASGLGGMGSAAVAAVAKVASATAAVKALISAAKECVEAFKVQEQAETRLAAVLKASGNQIGMTVDELKQLATATQSITKFGDEAVLEAEKVLIATQSLDKDGLQRAIAASADLAEAMGTDIVSAASTMAYALQDPGRGLERLRSQGLAFTDEEIAQVKALQDANDLYGAQALVLEKIESRYKGVAQAVGDTPTGTLDKIKNVWGDIKEGLGGALVDALGPAIELIYQGLLKISEWINRARASVRTEQEVNKLTYSLQNGGGFGDFQDDLLYAAIEEYQHKIDTWNLRSNYSQGYYQGLIRQVNEELDRRAEARANELKTKLPEASVSPGSGSSAAGEGSTESAISAFLRANGSASTSYKYNQYQKIIDEAQALRDQMFKPIVPGASMLVGDTNLREEWGMSLTEFMDAYNQLGEIIDETKQRQDKLFEEPEEQNEPEWLPTDYLAEYNTAVSHLKDQLSMLDEQIGKTTDPATLEYLTGIREGLQAEYDGLTTTAEAVDGLDEYLKENASLSATAQRAALDAKIAEAEAWRNAENLGEDEIRILDEIIAKLKEQRGELDETSETWKDTAKAILSEWTPVINNFQEMTSAVTGFMTQMWESQADEMEEALERDKEAGDMTEEEEADRLKKINDLRRKSFEAEKANNVANALINGALAVTRALAEMGPVAGPIAAGLIAATTAVQIATISAQQFTPMAKGGIVTQATPIIAGEAGPEAIIPLSGGRGRQYLDGSAGVVINITIQGNADEDMIFHAIERAQRTGYLPNWQYV